MEQKLKIAALRMGSRIRAAARTNMEKSREVRRFPAFYYIKTAITV